MDSMDCIEQKGIIEEIRNGIARVNITSFSACGSCQSKGACQISESSSRIIDVNIEDSMFHVGETVQVLMEKSLGLKATLLAYIIPFIIVISALITLTETGISELISGAVSLGLLAPYYIALYFNKDKLQKQFQFTLKKET